MCDRGAYLVPFSFPSISLTSVLDHWVLYGEASGLSPCAIDHMNCSVSPFLMFIVRKVPGLP
jgi:hypothetical protein